ncbi:MAG: ring-cleaving dioxygenase [Candidatus Promineifilaceae bacterium]|nr:ring-cleaving dioxygenase [Candidatus Promineifilaceae bacterium]
MAQEISGIHHITAIASDPQRTLDFYTDVLGLRLVKLTVNFDDPGTYHFYFADAEGQPGTILTFFPWPGARPGQPGNGQVSAVAFSIPPDALDYWQDRLRTHGVSPSAIHQRFEEAVLPLRDPDGLQLELVAHEEAPSLPAWDGGPVPAERAIRGFHHAALWESDAEGTAQLLTETFGFRPVGDHGGRLRFAAQESPGRLVDVVNRPDGEAGIMGAGAVHHIAWRTPDDEQQQEWRRTLIGLGYGVTPVKDRQYFHSIYFREPGGVLFEIATDPPGFTLDESPDELGTHLKLPPWLEESRSRIEEALPDLSLPSGNEP